MRRLFWIIPVLSLLAGCSRPMIAAFGSNSEIVIVTSPRCIDQATVLKSILERDILTVQHEQAFEVRLATTADIRPERSRKNIILLDFLRPESLITDAILSVAGRDKDAFLEGRLNRKEMHDRWARGQVLLVIATETQRDLEDLLARESDAIFSFVSDAVQRRLNRSLFNAGEQKEVSQRLSDSYGWELRLPPRYKVDESHAAERVIKIQADRPARMITVYWEDGSWDDMAGTCLERKKMLAWEFWDQDELVEESLNVGEGRFGERDCIVLSGTWDNKKYTIGGVFATYCFTCSACNRTYLVDASVFAPGLEKLPLVRELRAILATFRCCSPQQR
ncbi:MAG: DUF4837 family protein [Candidatus Eisenbacteria bacterium]